MKVFRILTRRQNTTKHYQHLYSDITPASHLESDIMPFRERLKKTFSRRSSATPSQASDRSGPDRNSSLFYQPGEKLPIKYRRPAEPSHMAKLEGFSFGNAWRRRSFHSQYSPMGSRLPSRQNSISSPSNAPIPEQILSHSQAAANMRGMCIRLQTEVVTLS